MLKVEKVTKAFGGLVAVNDVSFEIVENELSSIIGTFPRLTAFENVEVAVLSAQGKSSNLFSPTSKMVTEGAFEILGSVGLSDQKEILGSLLSHGDRRRLDIGIALASHPKLLMLDEPTAGMSPKESVEITELIHELAKERGFSLIFIEHDMNIVFSISEKIKVMHQGRIIFEGSPEEVRANREVQEIYL
jgi:branched-chain amino acid transport system ATP-binding protein